LQKNQSIILTFKATVNKIGEHTNWVCLTHLDFPNWEPDSNNPENCDPADVVVREKAYCTHPNPKNIDEYRDSLRRSITCETEGKKTARSIVLDCGNGTTFIASNVSSLTETCIYDRGSSTTKTFTPRCIVNGSDYNPIDNYTCSGKVVLRKSSGSGMGYCGDNEATDWEDCDCGRGNPKDCPLSQAIRNPSQVSSSKWDDYRNKGYRCINCKIQGKGDISAVEPIACFNINNGSISIEEGEMLPFYWNIEKIDNDQYVDVDGYDNEDAIEAYNRLSKNAGLGDATNGGKTGLTCDDYEHGDIALNAMVCTFRVYN